MSVGNAAALHEQLLATILSEESFRPIEPRSIEDTGLPSSLVESLVFKYLSIIGQSSGRGIADKICLPFGVLEKTLHALRSRQLIVHSGSAPLNDYYYNLTELGRDRAQAALNASGYVGPAPVPLKDYVLSAEAQTIRAEAPRREQLVEAFADISVDQALFETLGPAINSGAGLFLYGAPGNGKSTLATRVTICFGQHVWVPHAITEDGLIIKVFDAAFHRPVDEEHASIVKSAAYDRRWIRIRRPTVVVGGELTMDALEIRHDPRSNVSEAPCSSRVTAGAC